MNRESSLAEGLRVDVRPMRESDLDGFYAVLATVVAEKRYLMMVTPPGFADMRHFMNRNFDSDNIQYAALMEHELIGWITITRLPRETQEHVATLGMGVLPAWRGRGVGNRLLGDALEAAWRSGIQRIELEVFADNDPAIGLYEKHGFIREGVKRKARRVEGQYQDIVIMGQCRMLPEW